MPRSLWFKVFVVLAALWAPFSQADTGWQPIQETIRKSEKDTRQYQAIRLDNDMVVLLVSDPPGGEIAVGAGGAGGIPAGSGRSSGAGAFSGTYDADGVAKISPA